MRSPPHASAGARSARWAARSLESAVLVLCPIPGLKVVTPSSAFYAKGLLVSAIRDDDPVIFCVHKLLLGRSEHVPEESYKFPVGRARVARRGGT